VILKFIIIIIIIYRFAVPFIVAYELCWEFSVSAALPLSNRPSDVPLNSQISYRKQILRGDANHNTIHKEVKSKLKSEEYLPSCLLHKNIKTKI
jgi:hypothetical protein